MKKNDNLTENKKFDIQIKAETYFAEEQSYIWSNMSKIEKIKKETFKHKHRMLRKTIRPN